MGSNRWVQRSAARRSAESSCKTKLTKKSRRSSNPNFDLQTPNSPIPTSSPSLPHMLAQELRRLQQPLTDDIREEWIPLNNAVWKEIRRLRLAKYAVSPNLEARGCALSYPARQCIILIFLISWLLSHFHNVIIANHENVLFVLY